MLRLTRHALVGAMLLPLTCAAQIRNLSKTTLPVQQQGPLIVWMVTPATKADRQRIALEKELPKMAPPATISEQTAGSFGKAASDVGQTAGSYGTPSSNTGQNASDTGQTAGSYGQTSGSFGQTAGSTGQTAGSYGQTASTFGQNASNVGQTAGSYGHPSSDTNPVGQDRNKSGVLLDNANPELEARIFYIVDEELKEKLDAVAGTESYPDILVDARSPVVWGEPEAGLQMLGTVNEPKPDLRMPATMNNPEAMRRAKVLYSMSSNAVITVQAPRGERARDFVLQLRDTGFCSSVCGPVRLRNGSAEPARVAGNALISLLQGSTFGASADAEAAEFSGESAQLLALNSVGTQRPNGALQIKITTLSADANERIAVVTLRAIISSQDSFGVVHALAVLRKNHDGLWKVLQLTPNMTSAAMQSAKGLLQSYTGSVAAKDVTAMPGISQAAPVDGDNRPPQPDLWWDNKGGATLQAVEWQMGVGSGWSGSNLQLIADTNPRLVTQVRASFAKQPEMQYRWRVWSVGRGGAMTLSPWRTIHILPQ